MAAEIPNIKPDILIIVSINRLGYSWCNVIRTSSGKKKSHCQVPAVVDGC